jgi:NAD(P)-dependent dehydrogenase (short-subunit alcohol dehydrogenase family)
MPAPILLITGASRGIGAATARMAASRGYDVAVNYLENRAAADAVVADVVAAGRRAIAVQADMGNEADIAKMFAEVDKLGRLSHFVYNTGITGDPARLEAADHGAIRKVIETNVLGAFFATKAAILRMSKKHGGPGGAMVLMSSAASTLGGAGEFIWYGASKGAIDTMIWGLSKELVGDGIRVNGIQPGPIDTEIHYAGRLAKVLPHIPMGRAGKPDEIAEAVLFLLSEASAFTTGAILRIAGGR